MEFITAVMKWQEQLATNGSVFTSAWRVSLKICQEVKLYEGTSVRQTAR